MDVNNIIYRAASLIDIKQMQLVRNAVKENVLSNPELITEEDYQKFITTDGKEWVCEVDGNIVGFSIVDLKENNVWALFVLPEYEKKGIGKNLHNMMLSGYFAQTKEMIWLGTSPNTRAEGFYRKAGWVENGKHAKGEIKFEMTFENWIKK